MNWSKLPRLNYKDRHDLPETAGIYFFRKPDGEVIYVGSSENIRNRILRHNILWKHKESRGSDIFFIAFKTTEDYRTVRRMRWIEKYFIGKFKPRFNTHGQRYYEYLARQKELDRRRKERDERRRRTFQENAQRREPLPQGMMYAAVAGRTLGVSRQRVHQLIKGGKLPARRVGSEWAVEKQAVIDRANGNRTFRTGRPRKDTP